MYRFTDYRFRLNHGFAVRGRRERQLRRQGRVLVVTIGNDVPQGPRDPTMDRHVEFTTTGNVVHSVDLQNNKLPNHTTMNV